VREMAEMKEMQDRLAAMELKLSESAGLTAKIDELSAALDAEKAKAVTLSESNARSEVELAKLRVAATIAKLGEPNEKGQVLPIPALIEAGLNDVLLFAEMPTAVQFAEGKSLASKVGAVLAQVQKSGLLAVNPQTLKPSKSTEEAPAITQLRETFDNAGGADAMGVTFEEWCPEVKA